MAEMLQKLRPDRDLQCYFERPSAIAAISGASPTGFTVSGTWRQQFDWCVIEWNRDNVFEHPALRYLPDEDLSGLTLVYEEERTNCIPLDSDLYPSVEWHALRIWDAALPQADPYLVCLRDHAAPVAGLYQNAYAEFSLSGTVTAGDWVGIEALGYHHTYQFGAANGLADALLAIEGSINGGTATHGVKAIRSGTTIRLEFAGVPRTNVAGRCPPTVALDQSGHNGNRVGAYTYTSAGATASWDAAWKRFAQGVSPTRWRVTLDFSNLRDYRTGQLIPTNRVRKMRWTYAADLQFGAYQRSEFAVTITNWAVTGSGRAYLVAGPGSQRWDDRDAGVTFTGGWITERGNYSGGAIRYANEPGAAVQCTYTCSATHRLYLGTRLLGFAAGPRGANASVAIDGGAPVLVSTDLPGEDVLSRRLLAVLPAGTHTVIATHAGASGQRFSFDFFEAAVPVSELPDFPVESRLNLSTDWDTDHSIVLAPERTAWLLHKLGFHGRANHYVGALWFYELYRDGTQYASATVTFSGTPTESKITTLTINRDGYPPASATVLTHLHHVGDTAESIARAFELELNRGYNAVRATLAGSVLTIWSRTMGEDGEALTLSAATDDPALAVTASGDHLTGGENGTWFTDLAASPRINRACRDWSRAFFAALHAYNIDATAAFSTELQHVDPSLAAGMAQRGPALDPIVLPTPAIQTNFSPTSQSFWREVYREMAALMREGGVVPYLQFGEVQWWYFPNDGLGLSYSGMPFYDAYSTTQFTAQFGRPMAVIPNHQVDADLYPDEVAFLKTQLGAFTAAMMTYVRQTQPNCRFEVLYPTDVNQTQLNRRINYPEAHWTPAALDCLKTESFGFTLNRDLNLAEQTIRFGESAGFAAVKRAHLTGIGDPTSPWLKEARLAEGRGHDSVTLFALDQFCLIGYSLPLERGQRRSLQMG